MISVIATLWFFYLVSLLFKKQSLSYFKNHSNLAMNVQQDAPRA